MYTDSRIKNIVNPYPEDFTDDTSIGGDAGRSGDNYNYQNERNKWVIEAIHESYVSYGAFPVIGLKLSVGGPITLDNNEISLNDAMAYAALYPQNAYIIKLRAEKISGVELSQYDFSPLSNEEKQQQLREMYSRIKGREPGNTIEKYTSLSCPGATQDPEDEDGRYRNLISIPSLSSQGRIISLRRSVALNPYDPTLGKVIESYDNILYNVSSKQRSNINFTDWTKNVTADKERTATYLNKADNLLYFVTRTRERSISRYDKWNNNSGARLKTPDVEVFEKQAFEKILEFLEIDYVNKDTRQRIISEQMTLLANYGDTNRPIPPDGVGVWLLGAVVSFNAFSGILDGSDPQVPPDAPDPKENAPGNKNNKNNNNNENNAPDLNDLPFPNSYRSTLPSVYRLAKNIVSKKGVSLSANFRGEDIDSTIQGAGDVLRDYVAKMGEGGVTPDVISGFNLQAEINKYDSFYPALLEYYELNSIRDIEEGVIDFRFGKNFEIKYSFYNGELKLAGTGISPDSFEKNGSNNVFRDLDTTASGYVYHAHDIDTLNRGADLPPWTVFLPRFTYPNPNQRTFRPNVVALSTTQGPSFYDDVQEGLSEPILSMDNIVGQGARGIQSGGKFTVDKSKALANYFGVTKVFETTEELASTVAKRLQISEKEVNNALSSALGSCDTGLAVAFKEAFELYTLFTKKATTRDLIAQSVLKAKEYILAAQGKSAQEAIKNSKPFEFGNLSIGIDNFDFYARRPDVLLQDVEREFWRQISCLVDLVGEGIGNTLLLNPIIGEAPAANQLVRDITRTTSMTMDFRKLYNRPRDTYGAFQKALERIITEFLKQLILSVLGDIVKSLLGCGPPLPEEGEVDQEQNILAEIEFGKLQINQLIDDSNIPVPIEEFCEKLGVNDRKIVENNGVKTVVVSKPTIEQLRSFHDDISDSCVMTEVQGLLKRNSTSELRGSLFQMMTDNIPDEDFNRILNNQKKVQIIELLKINTRLQTATEINWTYSTLGIGALEENKDTLNISNIDLIDLKSQAESLLPGDTKYGSLTFTADSIGEYLALIGDTLNNIPREPLDPNAAICSAKDLALLGNDTDLSYDQFKAQTDQQTEALLNECRDLCDIASGLSLNWEQYMKKQFDEELFPISEYYQKMLAWISEWSNKLQKLAASLIDAEQEAAALPPPPTGQVDLTETQMYQYLTGRIGDITLERPGVQMIANPEAPEVQIPFWSYGEGSKYVSFYISNNRIFMQSRDLDEDNNPITTSLGSAPTVPGSPIEQAYGTDGRLGARQPGVFYAGNIQEYNEGIASAVNNLLSLMYSRQPGQVDAEQTNNILSLLGVTGFQLRELFCWFWVTYKGRLRALNTAINKELFFINEDKCDNDRNKEIARAAMQCIQTRINIFIYNIGPMINATFGIANETTVQMMTSYLASKFEEEMTEDNLFEIFLSSMDLVDQAYSGGLLNKERVRFDISNKTTLREKFTETIRLSLQTLLIKIGRDTEFGAAAKIPFEQEVEGGIKPYVQLGFYIRTGRYNPLGEGPRDFAAETSLGGVTTRNNYLEGENYEVEGIIAALKTEASTRLFNSSSGEDLWSQYHLPYYVPVECLVAMSMIYMDKVVDVQGTFPRFKFYSGKRVAAADDAFLNLLNPANLSDFSIPYEGFPVTIGGKTYYDIQSVKVDIRKYTNQFNDIRQKEDMISTRLFDAGYSWFGYLSGDAYLRVLQLDSSDTAHRDFFNPLYNRTIPSFRRLSEEEQKRLIIEALEYDYGVGTYSYEDGNIGEQRIAMPNSYSYTKGIAWFERYRLMEIAGTEGQTFINVYKEAYDLNGTYTSQANRRKYDIGDEYTGDRAVKRNNLMRSMRGQRGALLREAKSDLAGYEEQRNMFFKPRGYSGSGYVGVSLPSLDGVVSNTYTVSGANESYRINCPAGLRTEPFSENMYNAWKNLKDAYTENPEIQGRAVLQHANTLEKVAINHIYFLLNNVTRRRIENCNLEDLNSAVNELKRIANLPVIIPEPPVF